MKATICDTCHKPIIKEIDVRVVRCTIPSDRDKSVWEKEVCCTCAMKAEKELNSNQDFKLNGR
jgi:RNase P subunit RPR2